MLPKVILFCYILKKGDNHKAMVWLLENKIQELEHTTINIQLLQCLSPNINNNEPDDEEIKKVIKKKAKE